MCYSFASCLLSAGNSYVASGHAMAADGAGEGGGGFSEADDDRVYPDERSDMSAAEGAQPNGQDSSDVTDVDGGAVFCGVYDRCGLGADAVSLTTLANGSGE